MGRAWLTRRAPLTMPASRPHEIHNWQHLVGTHRAAPGERHHSAWHVIHANIKQYSPKWSKPAAEERQAKDKYRHTSHQAPFSENPQLMASATSFLQMVPRGHLLSRHPRHRRQHYQLLSAKSTWSSTRYSQKLHSSVCWSAGRAADAAASRSTSPSPLDGGTQPSRVPLRDSLTRSCRVAAAFVASNIGSTSLVSIPAPNSCMSPLLSRRPSPDGWLLANWAERALDFSTFVWHLANAATWRTHSVTLRSAWAQRG